MWTRGPAGPSRLPPRTTRTPPSSLPSPPPEGGHTHPEQEGLQIFRGSPLLKNTIQGLHIPGAALGIPPGNKACRSRQAELYWGALTPPPAMCRLEPPLDLGPFTRPAGAAHICARGPGQDLTSPSPPPWDSGRDSCFPGKESKALRSHVTHPRAEKGRRLVCSHLLRASHHLSEALPTSRIPRTPLEGRLLSLF